MTCQSLKKMGLTMFEFMTLKIFLWLAWMFKIMQLGML